MILVVFWPQAAVVHQDVGVSTATIALVVECGGSFVTWRRRCFSVVFDLCDIAFKMNAIVAKSSLGYVTEPSVIHDRHLVAPCAVSPVSCMLGIVSPLQTRNSYIRLCFTSKVHICKILIN